MPRRVVYSTGPDGAQRPQEERSSPAEGRPPREQSIRVRRDRSGRKGKTVTVAGTFLATREDAAALLKRLKRICGGGGTLKPSTDRAGTAGFDLEIQGDHVERVLAELASEGFPAKRSGG